MISKNMESVACKAHSKHRRRWLVSGLASLGCLLLVVGTVAPAQATYYSGGMPSATFQIKPYSYNDQWQPYMDAALASWNSMSVVSISKDSGASASVTAASYSADWYGLYTPYGVSPCCRWFGIQLNARTLSADAGSDFHTWVRSSFAHELGHSLSLGDNPPTSYNNSLMRHDRNRSTVYQRTTYDTNEVNSYY